jgi:hypothetical protein
MSRPRHFFTRPQASASGVDDVILVQKAVDDFGALMVASAKFAAVPWQLLRIARDVAASFTGQAFALIAD